MPHRVGALLAYLARRNSGTMTDMDASKPITAAIFSAFLKCPTKAHLAAIGEPASGTFFANIEARISSLYKAAVKRRSPIGAEVAELLDFGQLWRSLDHEAITHHVDCENSRLRLCAVAGQTGRPPTSAINSI
jgi:hypothetical protein